MAVAKKAPPPPTEKVEVFDCEQYSEEWYALRLGMPTASNFGKIMAQGEGKVRSRLMRQLAGEIITGETAETYQSAAMQRGKDMEAAIRENFAFVHDVNLERVGFVRRALPRNRFVGCSPDALIDKDGVLEIKTMMPELMIELMEAGGGRFPAEHRAQCHGTLWVTGRSHCELVIGYRGMPRNLTFHVERDEIYIKEIAEAVEVFDYELRKLVEKIRAMGGGR